MTVKYFVDTKILIYLFSKDENEKPEACNAFIKKAGAKGNLVISAQVMSAFSVVMLRKFSLPPNQLKSILEDLSAFEVISISSDIVKKAVDIHVLNLISFWNSQIISCARSANCSAIVSEHLNHGQRIE